MQLIHTRFGDKASSVMDRCLYGALLINLGCRGDSAGSIKLDGVRLSPTGDCMQVRFPSKTDKEGKHEEWKSVVSNPFSPWTCFIMNASYKLFCSADAFLSEDLVAKASSKLNSRDGQSTAVGAFASYIAELACSYSHKGRQAKSLWHR